MKAKEYAQLFEKDVKFNAPTFEKKGMSKQELVNSLLMEVYQQMSAEILNLSVSRGGSDSAWLSSFREIEKKYKAFVSEMAEKGIQIKATFRKLLRDSSLDQYDHLNRLEYAEQKAARARGRGYIR